MVWDRLAGADLEVGKRAGRVSGRLDDMIISLYAHGMSVRDIQHHLLQIYDTELSHEQVSRITDQVLEEVKAWQARPLDPCYPVVFLDAIVVKVRDNHTVQAKPAYVAIGIDTDGDKHVLGIWLAKTPLDTATAGESARFWSAVMTDLQPGRARHPHRLHRRPARLRRGHPRGVPAHYGSALRGAPWLPRINMLVSRGRGVLVAPGSRREGRRPWRSGALRG